MTEHSDRKDFDLDQMEREPHEEILDKLSDIISDTNALRQIQDEIFECRVSIEKHLSIISQQINDSKMIEELSDNLYFMGHKISEQTELIGNYISRNNSFSSAPDYTAILNNIVFWIKVCALLLIWMIIQLIVK